MNRILKKFEHAMGLSRLGFCPICMRYSFLVMIYSIVAFAIACVFDIACGIKVGAYLTIVPMTLFTSVWLLHVIVYGIRRTIQSKAVLSRDVSPDTERKSISKRMLIRYFGASVGTAAFSTAFPKMAFANYVCNGAYCSDQTICCFNNRSGFGYCCSPNTRCGDDGYCY